MVFSRVHRILPISKTENRLPETQLRMLRFPSFLFLSDVVVRYIFSESNEFKNDEDENNAFVDSIVDAGCEWLDSTTTGSS